MEKQAILMQEFATCVRNNEFKPELKSAISEPLFAKNLIVDLVSLCRQTEPKFVDALKNAMKFLEAVVEFDCDIGCALMVHLQAIAENTLGAHDISDGIDFWTNAATSRLVKDQLRYYSENCES